MTAQFLQTELTNLIQEAKRKNSDLRHATEKSLSDLKAISPAQDVAVELSNKPGFITPFIIACGTRNAKFISTAVSCLQRLTVSKSLPKSRLKEVLEALKEAANLGTDIQLKILQALPPLLQNYADDLQGPLLGETLLICAILQGSKTGVVNNTAAATLSQIVISICDKVVAEDERALEIPATHDVTVGDQMVAVRPAALDAYRVFSDICLLTEGKLPQHLRFTQLPQPFGLELIESVLTNHPDMFLSHPEQAHILRTRVAPLVIRSLSERLNFPTTVRITRVLYILLRRHLSILSGECGICLNLLTHMLEPDASQPWKRALCLEVFRGICAEPALIRRIFAEYDARPDGKPIVREMMGAMTRLSTERPSVIGLGTQSSAPVGQQLQKDSSSEQAALEAGGVAGIIGGAVGLEANIAGLGSWSLIRVPCIDQLDKSEPPAMPDSYIYYLTLICINSFLEGLAKFVLPLAISEKRRARSQHLQPGNSDTESAGRPATPESIGPSGKLKKRHTGRSVRVPTNPLTLESHPLYEEMKTASALVDACWPAILAACSTFLYATLENDLYHSLVRAFQKFTHVAGVFRLSTPRDAFLTTLGKAAVPSNVLQACFSSTVPPTPTSSTSETLFSNAKGLLGVDSENTSSNPNVPTSSLAAPSLNVRNLLCLRALLNLGIALGSTLEQSWAIILETLQQADYVLFASARRSGRQLSLSGANTSRTDSQKSLDSMSNIGPELSAVETASSKMFEATKDFPDDAFVSMVTALCKLLDPEEEKAAARRISTDKPRSPTLARGPSSPVHKRIPSASSISTQIIGDNAFALTKIGELALINMSRLIAGGPEVSGWKLIVNHLVNIGGSRDMNNSVRLKAAEVLNEIVVVAAKSVTADNCENVGEVQRRILNALKEGIENPQQPGVADSATKSTEMEIHRAGLEALNAILEHTGENLVAGWEIAFDIITSVFDSSMIWKRDSNTVPPSPSFAIDENSSRMSKNVRLIKSSFSSLELICSDFLASLPTGCVLVLVDALFAFCAQKDDLNISLTAITFFWNVSAFLQSNKDSEQSKKGDALTAAAENEKDLLDIVEKRGVDSHSALWMLLLLRLTAVSKDQRAEVRNGSIQTLFRIFDTYGDQLGPQGWSSCLKIVVFKMMHMTPEDLAIAANAGKSERKQWDDTIGLVLHGIGTLYSNYFDIFTQQEDFRNTWTVFVRYLEALLRWRSFEVSTSVFRVLSKVLDQISTAEKLAIESREEVWQLWSSQGVKLVEGVESSGNGIQETLTAYFDSFRSMYRLLESTITAPMVKRSLELMEECVLFPDAPPYFSDVDQLTPLQASIMDCIKIIRTDIPKVPSILLKHVADISTIAYRSSPPAPAPTSKRLPTCIALSTQCMKYLEHTSTTHITNPEIYLTSAFPRLLAALNIPIALKYDFHPPNLSSSTKRPSQWIVATTCILSILRRAIPVLVSNPPAPELPDDIKLNCWTEIITLVSSILRANPPTDLPIPALRKDEAFDITSFRSLRSLLLPWLGLPVLPDAAVNRYLEAVFTASLLHPFPITATDTPYHGTTDELPLERRSILSYVCIDELFSLVSIHATLAAEEEHRPLLRRVARLAEPWLVRRVGAVMAAYVKDQPLRGRMPQAVSQRKEMVYLVREMVRLESEGEEGQEGRGGGRKGHLRWLRGLCTRCVRVAVGDQELLRLLARALEEMEVGR